MSKFAVATSALVVAILVFGPWVSPVRADECEGTIRITIEHVSSSSNSVLVVDAISGDNEIQETMKPWATKDITICKSSAGYGRIKYKKGGQSSWTESSLLSSGQTVKI